MPLDTTGQARLSASVFVGRDREMTELRAGLDDARSGRGRLFLLTGEPGIGKTRVADEFTRYAASSRAQVAWGRCWEGGGAPPYWPWVQVLRACLSNTNRDQFNELAGARAHEITQIVPELRQWLRPPAEIGRAHV